MKLLALALVAACLFVVAAPAAAEAEPYLYTYRGCNTVDVDRSGGNLGVCVNTGSEAVAVDLA